MYTKSEKTTLPTQYFTQNCLKSVMFPCISLYNSWTWKTLLSIHCKLQTCDFFIPAPSPTRLLNLATAVVTAPRFRKSKMSTARSSATGICKYSARCRLEGSCATAFRASSFWRGSWMKTESREPSWPPEKVYFIFFQQYLQRTSVNNSAG